jgi:hypothetical protein
VVSEFLQTVPAFLGGNCSCLQCRKILGKLENKIEEMCTSSQMRPDQELWLELDEAVGISLTEREPRAVSECNHVLRSVVIGLLMLCIVMVFLAGLNEHDSLSLPL